MKKQLLSILAMCLGAVFAAAAQPATPPETGVRYDNIYRSSMQYLTFYGFDYVSSIEGKISTMVKDGNDFYLYQPVATFSVYQPYWIKGTLQEDGQVVFPMPQELYTNSSTRTKTYGHMLKAIPLDATLTRFSYEADDSDLVMNWDGKTLSQTDAEGDGYARILGICEADGTYTGNGEGLINWSIFTEQPTLLPEELQTRQYVVTFDNGWQEDRHTVEIATSGTDMWIKGLYQYFPESCIHGTIDGDKVKFDSNQYLGIYTTEMYYYFFQAADVEIGFDEEWGEETFINIPAPCVTLTKDGDTYTADRGMLMTFGMNTANTGMPAGSCKLNAVFTPYEEKPATPADPVITYVGDYYDPWGRSISFDIPVTDTEGNYINPDNMYYNVYVDGKLYSLTPEIYGDLTETITDIPYNFSKTGVVFTNGGTEHTLTLYIEGDITFGVQSFYTVGGETHASALVSTEGSSVETLSASATTTEYLTLSGQRVANPAAGIYIRVDHLSDGSVRTSKHIAR